VRTTSIDDEARLVIAMAADGAGSRRGQRELMEFRRIILDSSPVGLVLISADPFPGPDHRGRPGVRGAAGRPSV